MHAPLFHPSTGKTKTNRDSLAPVSLCFASAMTLQHEFASSYLTNKEASTVFCSVVKRAGNGGARKKCGGKRET